MEIKKSPNMLKSIFIVSICLFCFIKPAFSGYKIKDQIISKDYDKYDAPTENGKPVDVYVTMHVINFRLFKEKELSFTMDIFLHLNWRDHRLNMNWLKEQDITLSSAWMKDFWMPDVYFKNGISGHLHTGQFQTGYFILNKTADNKAARVFLASRVTVEFLCDFDFKNYPHDQHRCDLDLMSLSERNNSVRLNWGQFRVSKRVYNPDFHLSNPNPRDCTTTYPIGTYSCVRGRIELTRLVRRHLARKYTPTFLIVLTSFVGFWIPTTSYPARVSILVISLLALITQLVQSQPVRSIQTISYNIWSSVCIGLVFLALLEFAVAIVWEDNQKKKKAAAENDQANNKPEVKKATTSNLKSNRSSSSPNDVESANKKDKGKGQIESGTGNKSETTTGTGSRIKNTLGNAYDFMFKIPPDSGNLIDAYSKRIFPFIFATFIIGYMLFVKFRE